jgi:hypothetical protein
LRQAWQAQLKGEIPMCEVIPFDAVSRRSPPSLPRPAREMPYETYLAYQRAEAAFKVLYFGSTVETEILTIHPADDIVQQHWRTVEQLAATLLRDKSLSREQVLKLLLRASLDTAVNA